MKKIFSLFAAVLFAGSMMAGEYSFTFAKGDLTTSTTKFTKDEVEWTLSAPETQWNGTADKNGYVFGSASNPVTLTVSTSGIEGTITKVSVVGRSNNKDQTASVAVKVGTTNFTGSNTSWNNGNNQTASFTGSAAGSIVVTITPNACGFVLYGISVEYTPSATSVAKPVIAGNEEFFDESEVSITCGTEGAKIYYTLDGTEPSASSNAYTAAFKLTASATVKAIAIKGEDKSSIAEKKFTKAPAYASIEELVAAGLATDTKITVSFSEVAITNIFVNKSDKRQGLFLNVKAAGKDVEIYYNSDEVPAAWIIGGIVSGTIQGTWTSYNGQWEIIPVSSTWKWTELTYNVPAVIAIIIPTTSYNAPAAGVSGTINVTYNNIDDLSSAAVAFYEEDGTTPATYEWLATSFDEEKNVKYTVAASEEAEARVAYLKVYVGEVYSELVTITQAKYVPAFATLPFEFDGGKADIDDTPGLTHSGLGSDYTASPKLKFDGTNDYLILQIKEDAGKLSYDIKGNSFSGSTFKVQTSADGENYTDVKVYTELGDVATEKLDVKSGVRYIKWIYTEKSAGNVALGNISLGKAVDPTGIENTAVEAKALKTIENGQLVIIKNGVKYNVTGAIVK